MKHARLLSFSTGLFLLAGTVGQTARAAVYLPIPDRDLAREATAVVLARPLDHKRPCSGQWPTRIGHSP